MKRRHQLLSHLEEPVARSPLIIKWDSSLGWEIFYGPHLVKTAKRHRLVITPFVRLCVLPVQRGPQARGGARSCGMVEWTSIGSVFESPSWDVQGFITLVFVYASIRLICFRKVCKRPDLSHPPSPLPSLRCWQLSVSILHRENPAVYTLSVWVCYLSDGFKVPHTHTKGFPSRMKGIRLLCIVWIVAVLLAVVLTRADVSFMNHFFRISKCCISQDLSFITYMSVQGITFEEFRSFFQFLNNLEDFTIAMQMYNFANRSVGQGKESHGSCTTHTLGNWISWSCLCVLAKSKSWIWLSRAAAASMVETQTCSEMRGCNLPSLCIKLLKLHFKCPLLFLCSQ